MESNGTLIVRNRRIDGGILEQITAENLKSVGKILIPLLLPVLINEIKKKIQTDPKSKKLADIMDKIDKLEKVVTDPKSISSESETILSNILKSAAMQGTGIHMI